MFNFKNNPGVNKTPNGKADDVKPVRQEVPLSRRDSFQELKNQLHKKLIDRLDLTALAGLDRNSLYQQIKEAAELLVVDEYFFLWNPRNG